MEKGGGWKTSRMTLHPKRGFGPPLVRYVFHPPQVSVLCFSCTKIHDRADQKLFWRGPKIFGRARSLVRFPPPIRFAPPHITAQVDKRKQTLTPPFIEVFYTPLCNPLRKPQTGMTEEHSWYILRWGASLNVYMKTASYQPLLGGRPRRLQRVL